MLCAIGCLRSTIEQFRILDLDSRTCTRDRQREAERFTGWALLGRLGLWARGPREEIGVWFPGGCLRRVLSTASSTAQKRLIAWTFQTPALKHLRGRQAHGAWWLWSMSLQAPLMTSCTRASASLAPRWAGQDPNSRGWPLQRCILVSRMPMLARPRSCATDSTLNAV